MEASEHEVYTGFQLDPGGQKTTPCDREQLQNSMPSFTCGIPLCYKAETAETCKDALETEGLLSNNSIIYTVYCIMCINISVLDYVGI